MKKIFVTVFALFMVSCSEYLTTIDVSDVDSKLKKDAKIYSTEANGGEYYFEFRTNGVHFHSSSYPTRYFNSCVDVTNYIVNKFNSYTVLFQLKGVL